MTMRRSLLPSFLLVTAAALASAGCELVTSADRSKIDGGTESGTGGSAGMGSTGSGGMGGAGTGGMGGAGTGGMGGAGGMGGQGGTGGAGTGGMGGAGTGGMGGAGTGGMGGAGTGGMGGMSSGTGGMGGAGGGGVTPTCMDGVQNGTETGVDCGGPACPPCAGPGSVVILAGGPSGLIGTVYNPGTEMATTTSLPGRTVDAVSLVPLPSGQMLGAYRFTELGNPQDNQLQYTTLTASTWSAFTTIGSVQSRSALYLSGTQGVYQGLMDYKYYYLSFASGSWSAPEPVGAIQSFGPVGAALASRGSDATLLFANGGSSNHLYAQDRTGGAWSSALDITGSNDFNIVPSVVAPAQGAELLAVFVQSNGGQVAYATRSAGTWSAVAPIAGATSADRVGLVALAGGHAAAAYRGTDGNLHVTMYDGASWSAPVQAAAGISGAPAVSAGIAGASLEVAFVKGGDAYLTRYVSNAWTTPTMVGSSGDLMSVAVAVGVL
jgi:hypothetical protein